MKGACVRRMLIHKVPVGVCRAIISELSFNGTKRLLIELADSSSDLVTITDVKKSITIANHRALRDTGYEQKELIDVRSDGSFWREG